MTHTHFLTHACTEPGAMQEKRLRKTLITELSTFKHSTREGSQWWGGEKRAPREGGKEGGRERGKKGVGWVGEERDRVVFWPLRSLIQMLRHEHTDNQASDMDSTKQKKKQQLFLTCFLIVETHADKTNFIPAVCAWTWAHQSGGNVRKIKFTLISLASGGLLTSEW